jgi:hypothetical protein
MPAPAAVLPIFAQVSDLVDFVDFVSLCPTCLDISGTRRDL